MASNGLVANASKTSFVIIGHKAIKSQTIKIGSATVKQENGAKLLGMSFTDDLQWKTHINKTITSLNSRLFLIMRLKNKIGFQSLKIIADSLFNSKLRNGIQLCCKVRTLDSDSTQGFMNDLQKSQNKLFRLLNNTRLKDKINTKSIASKLNMLSVNQINAQVKLTEMWKATNVSYYPIPLDKKAFNDDSRLTRSITRGDIVLQGRSELCNSSFMFDASKIWNNAPSSIKERNTIYKAKKEIKKFVSFLPL